MRKLREQRVNRGRFQGFRRPLNMCGKGRALPKGTGKGPEAAEQEEQAFEASVSIRAARLRKWIHRNGDNGWPKNPKSSMSCFTTP
jgi:hypothetical protein